MFLFPSVLLFHSSMISILHPTCVVGMCCLLWRSITRVGCDRHGMWLWDRNSFPSPLCFSHLFLPTSTTSIVSKLNHPSNAEKRLVIACWGYSIRGVFRREILPHSFLTFSPMDWRKSSRITRRHVILTIFILLCFEQIGKKHPPRKNEKPSYYRSWYKLWTSATNSFKTSWVRKKRKFSLSSMLPSVFIVRRLILPVCTCVCLSNSSMICMTCVSGRLLVCRSVFPSRIPSLLFFLSCIFDSPSRRTSPFKRITVQLVFVCMSSLTSPCFNPSSFTLSSFVHGLFVFDAKQLCLPWSNKNW